MISRILLLILCAASSAFAAPVPGANNERITLFNSAIIVNKDASLDVQETIAVLCQGRIFKRGIFREFPTIYYDKHGTLYQVRFTLKDVRRDGKSEPYTIERMTNGVRIKIGNSEVFLDPGLHTYTITYNVTRELGFFKDYDELYWNVTGNGSLVPIDRATVRVTLPFGVPVNKITAEGYTGLQGAQETDYTTNISTQGIVFGQTVKQLRPKEGFTIVITWPKGFVISPTIMQNTIDFFRDNIIIFWFLIGFIIVLMYYIRVYLRARKGFQESVIIPLFDPPANLSPSAISFMVNKQYKPAAFSAQIVQLAVQGYLTIENKKGFLSSTYYLHKKDDAPETNNELVNALFSEGDTLELSRKSISQKALEKAERILRKPFATYGVKYFDFHGFAMMIGVFISILCVAIMPFLMVPGFGQESLIVVAIIIFLIINYVFFKKLQMYSVQGRKVMDQIEGFKLFLITAEVDRLKIIGTPPTKTPELYEKYLPYAMALGVEEQWSAQFTPVFERLASQSQSYQPRWYSGAHPFDFRAPHLFASNLTTSLNSSISAATISSSTFAPGSSSGSGGRGSSGGGGGGGGVGGW